MKTINTKQKLVLVIVACAVLSILLVIPQRTMADLIWEPLDNAFYTEHSDECTYVSGSYITRGPEGSVTAYKAPDNPTIMNTINNGEIIYLAYTCPYEGREWGYYSGNNCGWIPMDYLYRRYDNTLFEEEYAGKIVNESGTIGEKFMNAGEEIELTFWVFNYPGSEDFYSLNISSKADYFPEYSKSFVDEEGRKWGKLGYFRGVRNVWMCVEDPTAIPEEMYPNGFVNRDKRVISDYTGEEIAPKTGEKLWWVIGAVIIVCAAAAGALFVLRRKSIIKK